MIPHLANRVCPVEREWSVAPEPPEEERTLIFGFCRRSKADPHWCQAHLADFDEERRWCDDVAEMMRWLKGRPS